MTRGRWVIYNRPWHRYSNRARYAKEEEDRHLDGHPVFLPIHFACTLMATISHPPPFPHIHQSSPFESRRASPWSCHDCTSFPPSSLPFASSFQIRVGPFVRSGLRSVPPVTLNDLPRNCRDGSSPPPTCHVHNAAHGTRFRSRHLYFME
jgi:hypothetical protein